MALRILRLPAVIELSGLSRSSIYLMISNGNFPRQVSLGTRAVGWRECVIHAWLDGLPQKTQPWLPFNGTHKAANLAVPLAEGCVSG
jgi:prophage regulatory protein